MMGPANFLSVEYTKILCPGEAPETGFGRLEVWWTLCLCLQRV